MLTPFKIFQNREKQRKDRLKERRPRSQQYINKNRSSNLVSCPTKTSQSFRQEFSQDSGSEKKPNYQIIMRETIRRVNTYRFSNKSRDDEKNQLKNNFGFGKQSSQETIKNSSRFFPQQNNELEQNFYLNLCQLQGKKCLMNSPAKKTMITKNSKIRDKMKHSKCQYLRSNQKQKLKIQEQITSVSPQKTENMTHGNIISDKIVQENKINNNISFKNTVQKNMTQKIIRNEKQYKNSSVILYPQFSQQIPENSNIHANFTRSKKKAKFINNCLKQCQKDDPNCKNKGNIINIISTLPKNNQDFKPYCKLQTQVSNSKLKDPDLNNNQKKTMFPKSCVHILPSHERINNNKFWTPDHNEYNKKKGFKRNFSLQSRGLYLNQYGIGGWETSKLGDFMEDVISHEQVGDLS